MTSYFTTTDYNWFAQDNWRVNNQLTINLGLRYEYQQMPQPGDTAVKGVKFTGNPAYPATTKFHQDKNNWGPRVGFTYDINGTHQTVLRGGWGIYYGRSSNSVISSALTNNARHVRVLQPDADLWRSRSIRRSSRPPPQGRPHARRSSTSPRRSSAPRSTCTKRRSTARSARTSRCRRRYLRSTGKHLPTFLDTNLNQPNATVEYFVGTESKGTFPFYRGARPDTTINNAIQVADIVESTYNAMVLQVNKRFSKGLLFSANYTLSKSEDTGQNSTTFISNFATMVDPFDNESEKGPSSFDRRHRFVGSFHYAPELLLRRGGWRYRDVRKRPPAEPHDQRRRRGGDRRDEHRDDQRQRRIQPRPL